MVFTRPNILSKLEQVFEQRQAEVLAEVVEIAYSDLVKTSDFNELKAVVRELAEAQKRTEARVEELAEAQKRTEARVEELAEAQKRTEAQVKELAGAQKRTEQELQTLTGVVRTIQNTQADMRGDQLEARYRQHASAYLGAALRKVKVLAPSDLEDELEPRLPAPAYLDVLRADLLVRGQPRQRPDLPEVWLIVEVSAVVDRADVERAVRRAGHLRQAGYPAIAVVAGERATQGSQEQAEQDHAVMILDGQMAWWEDALAQV